jgi:hypothetical protein
MKFCTEKGKGADAVLYFYSNMAIKNFLPEIHGDFLHFQLGPIPHLNAT